MGTDPAQLQERLEPALGPAMGLESGPWASGTPAKGPEHLTRAPATFHGADLFTLGAMAYELLAGSHTFAGRAHRATLSACLAEALTLLNPTSGSAVGAAVVMRLLAKTGCSSAAKHRRRARQPPCAFASTLPRYT